MAELKISIIGAGSATFSLKFIQDLCQMPNLAGSEISLMDVNVRKLNHTEILFKRYVEEMGVKLHIQKTNSLTDSLRDADFVLDLALILGFDGYHKGWSLARKHGYIFGGSLHIMHDEGFWINFHQLQHMETLTRHILEICPDAWFLLLANPVMAATTYLSRKYKNLKIVGLCHGYAGVYRLAEALGLKKQNIEYEMSGVNHFLWLTKFTYNNANAFPLLDEWIEKKSRNYWQLCGMSDFVGPKPVNLYQRFGIFPIGDTANPGGGAWPWWYHANEETERSWQEDPDGWWQKCAALTDSWAYKIEQLLQNENTKITEVFPPEVSEEPTVPLIEALACNVPRTIYVNISNENGYVTGVPRDFAVEIPARITKNHIKGVPTAPLPKPILAHLLRDRVAPVEVELEAYDKQSKLRLLDLIMMDPWTKSQKQAEDFLEEILAADGLEKMGRHYK